MAAGAQIYQEVIAVIVKKAINWKESSASMWTSVCHSNLVKAVASIFLEVIAVIAVPATRPKETNASVIIFGPWLRTNRGKKRNITNCWDLYSFAINSHEFTTKKCLIGPVF